MLVSVYHDFFCQFGKTKIFVTKKPEGYGLVCHRAIKTSCEVIGIKDLYAKVEGPTNLQHIVKAFLIGLLQQVIVFLIVIICDSATQKNECHVESIIIISIFCRDSLTVTCYAKFVR
jgi:ribosomal protein S5